MTTSKQHPLDVTFLRPAPWYQTAEGKSILRILLFVTLAVIIAILDSGCGEIQEAIDDYTSKTITISHTIYDQTAERSSRSQVIIEQLVAQNGVPKTPGLTDVSEMMDPIAVSQIADGMVWFYFKAQIDNLGDTAAEVNLVLIPNSLEESPIVIGTVSLAARQNLSIKLPADLGAGATSVHLRIKEAVGLLDENLSLVPVILVEGGDSRGVLVESLSLAATPVYWRSKELGDASLSSYEEYFDGVHDTELTGTVTNLSEYQAEILIYLAIGDDDDLSDNLVAEYVLEPGEVISGEDMLVENAEDQMENAIEQAIKGKIVTVEFVIVSVQPVYVETDELKIKAKIDVSADLF